MSNRFPLESVRSQFPSLDVQDQGQARIYLDNPAGTQVPKSVATAISEAILYSNANLGGYFPTTESAGAIVENAHIAMADMLGCEKDEVVIGPNMTSLTYHFSRTIGRNLKKGDEIIVTQMDHEGNVAPWLQLADDLGLVIKKLPFNAESWQIEADDLKQLISDKTKVLALNYSSNLTGSINDVAKLVKIANDAGVLTYVDAVQFAPHGFVDIKAIDCDFLTCSSYKFFGPHLGILYGRKAILESLDPYKCRCSDNALPGRFETGTPQIELLAGLSACVDYLASIGAEIGEVSNRRSKIEAVFQSAISHEAELSKQLLAGLAPIKGLKVQGITDAKQIHDRVPTVSVTFDDMGPEPLVRRLNSEGIFLLAGHNYAWEVVHQLGIDPAQGVMRIGIANYNSSEEIDVLLEAIERNVTMLRQQL